MSTTTRPELSIKNKYWIERHRYYELKHFCMQYTIWKQAYKSLDGMKAIDYSQVHTKTNLKNCPVEKCAEAREYFFKRMSMIEKAAKSTDEFFGSYILKSVTEGLSYDKLRAQTDIPCCKDTYYELYRRFFWILNKLRN